ncbi:MSCRAMM family adhesin SdrC [Vibrio hippocampi]|uniref:Uncharacterized protein n=1 Tax=Vibrio hippocampi TaxID=654686 RepID=A0ABM8ZMB0_9VIBR|nr:MSCRAMM family adhesin SdrC [Vibrio hippocampi]CAH0528805.1 hypothetical protein VHP8226_02832 [Vibrio hippocampi]
MKSYKIALSILCASVLLAGCNSNDDSNPNPIDPPVDGDLTGVLWELSSQNVDSQTNTLENLPNVYYFSDEQLKYYYDDQVDGVYKVAYSDITNDEESKTITFNYYDDDAFADGVLDSDEFTRVSGQYAFENEQLIIDTDNFGQLAGNDLSDRDDVKNAVENADSDSGENKLVKVQDVSSEVAGDLRIALATDNGISSGTFKLDTIYRVNTDNEAPEVERNNTYVTLYDTGFSTGKTYGEIVLSDKSDEDGKGMVRYRDSQSTFSDEVGEFDIGEPLSIEATWGNDEFTFVINQDDVEVANKTVPYAVVNGPIKFISFRIGDVKNTSRFEVLGDNFEVYSNDEEKVIFLDDFESYSDGQGLAETSNYRGESAQATVVSLLSE